MDNITTYFYFTANSNNMYINIIRIPPRAEHLVYDLNVLQINDFVNKLTYVSSLKISQVNC